MLGCDAVYSEDLNDGQSYDSVLIINPVPLSVGEMAYCPVPQLSTPCEPLVMGEVRVGGLELPQEEIFERRSRKSGQCQRLNVSSLHRFTLRWLDHSQVERNGGIIDHLYANFGANPGSGEVTPWEGAHYCNTGMLSLIIHWGWYPVPSLLYLQWP